MDHNNKPPLPAICLKNLADKNYEKRKAAALEIESTVKKIRQSKLEKTEITSRIRAIVKFLVDNYASSKSNVFYRKGGLIGLAAAAIGMMDETQAMLDLLLPPVLHCFRDSEPRVRYYACEALYNIAKVSRGNILMFFNEIFDGLCRLFSDNAREVKDAAQLLDKVVKSIVTECDVFDLEKFVPLLKERIFNTEPAVRQLLLGWVAILDSVPDLDLLWHLPEFLAGIFSMLSDPSKDIRQMAYATLSELLRELGQVSNAPDSSLGATEGKSSSSSSTESSPGQDQGAVVERKAGASESKGATSTGVSRLHAQLRKLTPIVVEHCRSDDNFTRLTSLGWLLEFIRLGQGALLDHLPAILECALDALTDRERDVRLRASRVNQALLLLTQCTEQPGDLSRVVDAVLQHLASPWVPSRLASLYWINMLLTKVPKLMNEMLPTLFPPLLKALQDSDEQVVRLVLEVLSRMSLTPAHTLHSKNFEVVIRHLMKLFRADRLFLETRGALVIRQLAVLLDSEAIYRLFAGLLARANSRDFDFASLMVQTLNLILLTSGELFPLRRLLRGAGNSKEGRDLFLTLFNSWCHNPVATFALCILGQAYELAWRVVQEMARVDVTVSFLMEVDKLVQLIESPVFMLVRMHLLDSHTHVYLFKALYGLLMLLPQSQAFTLLKNRLDSVALVGALESRESKDRQPQTSGDGGSDKEGLSLDVETLVARFRLVQSKHHHRRQREFAKHSLMFGAQLGSGGGGSGGGSGGGGGGENNQSGESGQSK